VFTLGHNVRSPEEVDAVMARAEKAGATIVKPATKEFWGGYAGYFQDPDQHLWEVLWNPQFLPPDSATPSSGDSQAPPEQRPGSEGPIAADPQQHQHVADVMAAWGTKIARRLARSAPVVSLRLHRSPRTAPGNLRRIGRKRRSTPVPLGASAAPAW
jgi:hypothetical protein